MRRHTVTNTDTSAATTAGAPAVIPDFPMARAAGCPFDPPPGLRTLQVQAPITRVRLWDGSTRGLSPDTPSSGPC